MEKQIKTLSIGFSSNWNFHESPNNVHHLDFYYKSKRKKKYENQFFPPNSNSLPRLEHWIWAL